MLGQKAVELLQDLKQAQGTPPYRQSSVGEVLQEVDALQREIERALDA